MEEAAEVKENVNPVGGGLWGPTRRERRFGRSGLGLGFAGRESQSSRENAGVLAPNSTLGNCGSVEALQWLKDRVSQHKLGIKSFRAEGDSGSRHVGQLLSPAVDGNDKSSGALGKISRGLSYSKEVGRFMAGREQQQEFVSHPSPSRSREASSFSRNAVDHSGEKFAKNHRFSSGVQAAGAKSPWPLTSRGVFEVYRDDAVNSKEHHRVTSRSREIKSPDAPSLLVNRGLALGSDSGEPAKVSGLNSPSNVFLSKFQLHQDQKCVKGISSPQPYSQELGSGLWSGSKRPGTPFRSTELQSSQETVIDRPEGSGRGEQQITSSGQTLGFNLTKAEIGRSPVKVNDPQEVSRISELKVKGRAVDSLPSGGARTVTGDSGLRSQTNQSGNHSYPTNFEGLKSRIQQGDFLSLYPRISPPNNADNSNINTTAVGCGSTSLFSVGTGVSSSGSSSTPSLPENSFLEYDSVKSRDPSLLADKEVSSSSRPSTISNKVSKISKRPKYLGRPASRVLKDSVDPTALHNSGSRICVLRDSGESFNSSISPSCVSPIIESDCPTVTTAENVEESSGEALEHPSSDPRKKRKAERDLTGGDGDTSQRSEHSSSAATPVGAKGKDAETACQAQQRQILARSMLSEHPGQAKSKQSVEKFASPRLPTTLVSPQIKLEQPRISATSGLVHSGKASPLRTTTGAPVRREPKTAPHQQNHASEAFKDSCTRRDRRHPQINDGARESGLPLSELEYGARNGSEKRHLLGAHVPANALNGSDAQDMSHDGLSSLESKENLPIPVVPDLSNCLNSLSLGEEDLLKKDEIKLSSNRNTNRVSPTPSVVPSSQLITSESVGNCAAPPLESHSARSVISIDTSSRNELRIPLDDAGNPKNHEPPGKSTRRSPRRSQNPEGDISDKALGLPCNIEAKVRAFTSEEKALASGSCALQASDGSGKEHGQGATATPPRKTFENSYFVWVNNKRYQKLGRIGKGGSSEVFKVIDSDCNIYALKKINLKGREYRVALGFYEEIEYLERFRGKRNVIQLIEYEVTNRTVISEDYDEEKILEDAYIYMVLEFGEIDLANILIKKRKEMMESDEIIDENWLRFYWKHMLLAVKTIHEERIVHADLKPANFLLVKGELKLIDFGIAKAIQNDTTHIVRDSGVGTLNYMAPEAFMTNSIDEEGRTVKCGRASDIWSLGCILYQMVYGHTPFSHVTSFYAKIQAIACKTHKIQFPPVRDPWLLDAMKRCLTWDRHGRPQITDLLEHPFLRPELAHQHTLAV